MNRFEKKIGDLKKKNKKVIGCFPLYPPLELIHSMGLVPLLLWNLKDSIEDLAVSDKHLQNYTCSVGRCLTQLLLSEEDTPFDGFFMYNACDTLRNLPEIVDEGLMKKDKKIPFFKLHIPASHDDKKWANDYLKMRINKIIAELETEFKVKFSGENFVESIKLYKEFRDLSIEAESFVESGELSFSIFSNLCGTGWQMSVEEQIEKLKITIKELKENSGKKSINAQKRVILSGILSPPESLIKVIEESGMCVVGNDIATLSRSYGYNPDETNNPADYYTDFYKNHTPCTTILTNSDKRIDMFKNLIKEKEANGIIFIGEKFCEHEYFEFPFLEKTFKKMDINVLQLEITFDDKENTESYRTRIEAFSEILELKN